MIFDDANPTATAGTLFNGAMESFLHTLKTELVHHCKFKTKEEAKLAPFDYINIHYNRKRIHSALGYITPARIELKSA